MPFSRDGDKIDYERRNAATLADFVAFCERNPQLRFWQALAVWAGSNVYVGPPASKALVERYVIDTWEFEGRQH